MKVVIPRNKNFSLNKVEEIVDRPVEEPKEKSEFKPEDSRMPGILESNKPLTQDQIEAQKILQEIAATNRKQLEEEYIRGHSTKV